jgi:hypothetical protein
MVVAMKYGHVSAARINGLAVECWCSQRTPEG